MPPYELRRPIVMPVREPLATPNPPRCRPDHPVVLAVVIGRVQRRVPGWLGILERGPPAVTLILAVGVVTASAARRPEGGRCGIDGDTSKNTVTSTLPDCGTHNISAESIAKGAGRRGVLAVGMNKMLPWADPNEMEKVNDADGRCMT